MRQAEVKIFAPVSGGTEATGTHQNSDNEGEGQMGCHSRWGNHLKVFFTILLLKQVGKIYHFFMSQWHSNPSTERLSSL